MSNFQENKIRKQELLIIYPNMHDLILTQKVKFLSKSSVSLLKNIYIK